jgi:hypothetical protein
MRSEKRRREVNSMPKEMISGSLLATTAVPVQITMNGTDSKTVRWFADGKKAFLLNLSILATKSPGEIIVKSPKLHDNNLGIHFTAPQNFNRLLPYEAMQPMYSQDNLDILFTDTLAAGEWDSVWLEIFYEDLQSNNGNYVGFDAIKGKIKNIVTVEITDTPAGAVGYQTPHNLAFISDLLKANTNYALLGYKTMGSQTLAGFKGPCTGNYRIALPFLTYTPEEERDYFIKQALDTGFPCIPVLNRADVYGTFVDFLEPVGGSSNSIALIFGEL